MKVSVIGTGAMGSIYASFFAKNGFDVLCFDVWKEHVDAINEKGLRVSGISGDHTEKKLRATSNFHELEDRDLYIIATKGDSVGSVASKLANFNLKKSIVLTIQNGLGAAERIKKFMPINNVLLGVAQGFGASIKSPGHAHHNGMSMIRIGEINGGLSERLETTVHAWEKAGFTSKGFNDIQQLIWEKFICNVAYSGPCSVFKKTIGEILNDTNMLDVSIQCGFEARKLGDMQKINFSFIDTEKYIIDFGKKMPLSKPSMLQDVEAKRKCELSSINGMVVTLGKEFNIKTPYNSVVSSIISAREKEYLN
ncbi:MAG: 2-dehydropantoate 2-reductase [SAR116 cluster bacterium]|nr:2-dehydropantoate 2-reductase [SAR116 cluster bacterium]RPH09051.1 MAG: 2-dehydropantoate 2-reductase [Alphaproteobacteria bacterium TMED54]